MKTIRFDQERENKEESLRLINAGILGNRRAEYAREIVHGLSGQLSLTHFREIIHIKDDLKRDFYAEMCRVERWSIRTLHAKIQGMLFEEEREIHFAEYLTELPPIHVLEGRLDEAIRSS